MPITQIIVGSQGLPVPKRFLQKTVGSKYYVNTQKAVAKNSNT